MRRGFYLLAFFLSLTSFAWSQGSASPKPDKQRTAQVIVPPAVEQKFVIEHPDARATWKTEGGLYKAIFVNPVNNLGQITVYDETGKIVRKERELEQEEFPAAITEYQEKKFPGEGFAIWVSTDSAGKNLFYTQKNNITYWFDRDGRPLSRDKGIDSSLKSLLAQPVR